MSTKAYNAALDFMPGEAHAGRGIVARIKDYVFAMHAGLEAWREYERLTANGVAQDVAARRSFEKHFSK